MVSPLKSPSFFADAFGEAWAAPPSPAKAAGRRTVYLSEVVDEAPRYADWSEAPSWLQEDVDYYSDPENKTPLPFLLRGADSPALRILFNPPDYPPPRKDGSSRLWPCAIVSSGGAYEGISVAEARHGTGWLASLGVVAFALRYRLPPKHPWPAARDDVAAAVEFLRSPAAAAKFRVDRDRLVLLGFSAGSHLSAHALEPGVRAAVLVYPAWADAKDDQGRLVRTADHAEREARRLGDDRALLPDVYVVSSTTDWVCSPSAHGDRVVRELKRCGVHVHYQRENFGAHGFSCIPEWTDPCARWLRARLAIGE